MEVSADLQTRAINTLRFLSADAVQKANSGHPGLPMGAAALAYTLWMRHLKFNPRNPGWFDRDRFILSGGHGSMLLYSLLHLTGYDLSLEELENFRQWGSRTPGHPEAGLTPGVEVTSGPLGQGFGNGVGMAIATTHLAACYNRPDFEVVNHFIYAIVTDGDLMEGVASEAASLAGHLRLGRLIYLYDDNHISIDGSTDLAFTEDRTARFAAYGWHVQTVSDGNDVQAIDAAIQRAKDDPRPSLIAVRTHIGYGLPTRQDTSKAHGEPPGEEELAGAKNNLGWPQEPRFFIPEDVLLHYRQCLQKGELAEGSWSTKMDAYAEAYPELAAELRRRLDGELQPDWDAELPTFPTDSKGMATRSASGKFINAVAPKVPELIGGSADLAPSTKTLIDNEKDFSSANRDGRNLRFGVREHAMGAVLNGLMLHGGLIPYGATFLIFSDYMRPPMRLAAMNHLPVIYVFTHDSIGLGEDGPTHQPVEQILGLRSVPNMIVIRPADANETVFAWKIAIESLANPVVLILTRQKLPILDLEKYPQMAKGVNQGGYVLADKHKKSQMDIILIATGSEVHLALAAREKLLEDGINARVVSMPCWEIFDKQSEIYKKEILPEGVPILAIEAGITLGWRPYIGKAVDVIGVDRFGASAPGKIVMDEFGFNTYNVVEHVLNILGKKKEVVKTSGE